jgi:uncharacterized protein YjiS (DUF1127 family)
MTAQTLTGASAGTDGFFASLARFVTEMRRARTRSRTNLVLSDLDDFILDDIGVDPAGVRRRSSGMVDWVVQTQSGTARLVFIGR